MKTHGTFHGNDDLIAAFNNCGVRYLVVGGLAVGHYVGERTANDLDLLFEATAANADRAFHAFTLLGVTPAFDREKIATPGYRHLPLKQVQMGRFYADILLTDLEIDFSAEMDRSNDSWINGNEAPIASRELLVLMKSNTGREQDAEDVRLLLAAQHGR